MVNYYGRWNTVRDNKYIQSEAVIAPNKINRISYNHQPDTTGAYQSSFKVTKMDGGAVKKGSFSLQPYKKK
jgi:hypothetical protein